MNLEFSKQLMEKLRRDGAIQVVFDYLRDKFFFKTIVKYVINWKYKSQAVELVDWLTFNYYVKSKVKTELSDLQRINDKDSVVRQTLMYIINRFDYVGDMQVWGVNEYWQSPKETWMKLTGDCEDGAIALYCLLNWLGIQDDSLYIVAGDVQGGGHCYLVYRSENDGLEYPIDWCYWPATSASMKIPYVKRPEYNYGDTEWFRFNLSGSYKEK